MINENVKNWLAERAGRGTDRISAGRCVPLWSAGRYPYMVGCIHEEI